MFPDRCECCGNARLDRLGCPECRRRPPRFRSVTALGPYRQTLRRLIHLFKYQGAWDLAFPLGERLGALPMPPVDVLVPLPLHPERLRARGYNQAELLARVLAGCWHVPCRAGLARVRATQPQVVLGRAAREANMRAAFRAVGAGRLGRVGLVDDVLTSGATAQAAATALLENGAETVHLIVVARAIPAPWGKP